jgi:hypothetical protein
MRAFMSALLLSALTILPAIARSCDDDTIDNVSSDGEIVTTLSGAAFRVKPADRADTAFWLSGDDVLICRHGAEIIDKNEDNEHVSVRRIH